ncbi:Arylsulfatase A [Tenacibaculum sp. MAR_2009_124]|uniref:sulfatase family protein n=1 Tax=Tenacibaculum sp. MAR_2009_124 TaxID=1250059 RepID=UPI000898554B|nr:arylsulfatase [Tenacibaculum sp. MAR_2009_124]SED13804.1 Arylsulfatase A [Tenacibaculum sp. MAR_2009_124]
MGKYFMTLIILVAFSCNSSKNKQNNKKAQIKEKPNIVVFYVDDLGYGDLSSYGAVGVETPNVDKLAKGGIKYTDAHSSAATCTPSRYSLLTGNYAFRNQAAILPGDAPLIINPSVPTLPKMLKKAGYRTAVVGKWHLGLGNGFVDWNTEVKPGPLEIGFDYSFLLPATGDRTPTVYLENHGVVGLDNSDPLAVNYKEAYVGEPTGIKNPEMLRQKADRQHSQAITNGISRIGYQKGGGKAMWIDEEFPDVFTGKAIDFIRKNKDDPFFLFFSFHDIHVPRLPNSRFSGKSTMGPRGDAIAQMDWMTGAIVNELEKLGIDQNTMIIFTSDNGPILDDGYEDLAEEKLGSHRPTGPFRGAKYSAYEAGTRVPMIVYWPSKVKSGESNALVSQIDFYASFASFLGVKLKKNEAVDSYDIMSSLMNSSEKAREVLLEESFTLSIREGNYKYIKPITTKNLPKWLKNKKVETGLVEEIQLYDLSKDIEERKNIAKENVVLVRELEEKIDSIVNIN